MDCLLSFFYFYSFRLGADAGKFHWKLFAKLFNLFQAKLYLSWNLPLHKRFSPSLGQSEERNEKVRNTSKLAPQKIVFIKMIEY